MGLVPLHEDNIVFLAAEFIAQASDQLQSARTTADNNNLGLHGSIAFILWAEGKMLATPHPMSTR